MDNEINVIDFVIIKKIIKSFSIAYNSCVIALYQLTVGL